MYAYTFKCFHIVSVSVERGMSWIELFTECCVCARVCACMHVRASVGRPPVPSARVPSAPRDAWWAPHHTWPPAPPTGSTQHNADDTTQYRHACGVYACMDHIQFPCFQIPLFYTFQHWFFLVKKCKTFWTYRFLFYLLISYSKWEVYKMNQLDNNKNNSAPQTNTINRRYELRYGLNAGKRTLWRRGVLLGVLSDLSRRFAEMDNIKWMK